VDEKPLLQDIQQLLRRSIPTEEIAGFEPDRSVRPEPIRLRSTPAERAEMAARRGAASGAGRGPAHRRSGAQQGGGSPARHGTGHRRAGRGRPSGAPGTGFGNASPQGRGTDPERTSPQGRPAQGGRPAGTRGHGRPTHGSRPSGGHAGGHGGGAPGQPRSLPGERISRLG
jgi:ATP-dependent RNA helicase RhlE